MIINSIEIKTWSAAADLLREALQEMKNRGSSGGQHLDVDSGKVCLFGAIGLAAGYSESALKEARFTPGLERAFFGEDKFAPYTNLDSYSDALTGLHLIALAHAANAVCDHYNHQYVTMDVMPPGADATVYLGQHTWECNDELDRAGRLKLLQTAVEYAEEKAAEDIFIPTIEETQWLKHTISPTLSSVS